MDITILKNELIIKNNILKDAESIIYYLNHNIIWDNSMISRKTASFGVPYNYSGINYQHIEIPSSFNELIKIVELLSGFKPNNCLINFYYKNESKMGFHSDQIDILDRDSSIVIFSFGSSRILRFKNKTNRDLTCDILLENNSFLSMSQNIQLEWLHSILPDDLKSVNIRYSVTFRKILV
ncbi:alpha-ketoglutarate-dependent dioxygenase AlkB [Chryseobacterium schmidteae]|uniref:alpha-ketoglutarate-dependent dioxygenase AlkB n=1 Tax=Chryseobacterium schmidteae TaxID=2730404 RepID=UPI00158B46BA|nr:alpha-ketoglutarate-dependent dioxygenase AlkB [Chryseobacterium schmidteae]